jgi:uncharacterized protein (DUF1501 family)
MNRAEFLRLSSRLGIAAPFLLNGIPARANRWLEGIDLPVDCNNISDRVVVIVRLSGANDGLNTIVPVSQYDIYANIRPNLRLPKSGSGSLITLDSTLPSDRLSGLHPSMTGFKSLYDQGMLAILPGVGYPAPNYSHFASENTMFAGKDGNTNQSLQDGIFGRYLAAVFPNLAGNPNSQNRDPLAIHMGSSNPSLFYGHSHEIGVEYNITSLQAGLWATTGFEAQSIELPSGSEYQELLDFVQFIEKSMDVYYDRVLENFTAGNNSAISYPDTDLAKQLKTVARMLKGGSRTKIFQVTLGSFDTHVNQVVSDSPGQGTHATLLGNLSASILAFQNDLKNLGLADRVMTVTFSEFGRQVRQNANLGSDHGNISPFFVMGKQVQAGVLSAHPVLPSTGFQYADTERKFDYRQLFSTLLQDWLGSDNSTMQVAELDAFATAEQKLPIILPAAVVLPECYVRNLSICNQPSESIVAVARGTDGGWTWYAPADYTGNHYLLGILHNPDEEGGNTAPFTAEIHFSKKVCDTNGHPLVHSHIVKSPDSGTFVSGYYCNFKMLSGSLNGSVSIRFFTLENYTDALNTEATTYENELQGTAEPSILRYIHTLGNDLALPGDFPAAAPALNQDFTLLNVTETGSYLSYPFVGFRGIKQLHQTGIAAMRLLQIEQFAVLPRITCRFTGNGNFSDPANWLNNVSPISTAQKNIDIIIDPPTGGQCILDIPFVFEKKMTVTVVEGKVFVVK